MKRPFLVALGVLSLLGAQRASVLADSAEVLTDLHGFHERAVFAAARNANGSPGLFTTLANQSTNRLFGFRLGLDLGPFAAVLAQATNATGAPVDAGLVGVGGEVLRGLSLGYSFGWEDGKGEHHLSAIGRPFPWWDLGVGIENAGLRDPRLTASTSFRPFGEPWSLSYQFQALGSNSFSHSVATQLRLFGSIALQARTDFKEVYTGLGLRFGPLDVNARTAVLGTNRFTDWRFEAGFHFVPADASPVRLARPMKKTGKPRLFIPIVLRGGLSGLEGEMTETGPALSLMEFHLITRRILENRAVAGVVLWLEGPGGGWAAMDEVRSRLVELREAGKEIVVYSASYSQKEYFLASVADRIVIGRTGGVALSGFALEEPFFGEALRRLGVGVEVVRVGEYKNFAEPWSRSNFSAEAKESETRLVQGLGGEIFPRIAARRGGTNGDALRDGGPYTGKEALERKLVDERLSPEEFAESLASDGVRFRPLALLFPEDGQVRSSAFFPAIAFLQVVGNIVDGESSRNPLTGEISTGADTVVRALQSVERDPSIAALVLRVESGGGSAQASDLIWSALSRFTAARKIPLVASFGDVAASGGYYVAAGARTIYASPFTISGSVGVISVKPQVRGLLERFGVGFDGVRLGSNAGADSLFRPMTPSQREREQAGVDDMYESFLDVVRRGREDAGLSNREAVHRVARGRVWLGMDALTNGLVDEEGGIGAAVEDLEDDLGGKDLEYRLLNPLPASAFSGLMQSPLGRVQEALSAWIGESLPATDWRRALARDEAFLKRWSGLGKRRLVGSSASVWDVVRKPVEASSGLQMRLESRLPR